MVVVNPTVAEYRDAMEQDARRANWRRLTLEVTPEEHELFDKDCRYGYDRRVSMNQRVRAFIRRELGLPPLEELTLPKRRKLSR